MGLLHRLTDPRRGRRRERRDPAAAQADARWRRRAELMGVDRDLNELADEQSYLETEIARSRDHAARLDSEASAAAADGCAGIAGDLRGELSQTHAFLGELAEVRQAVTTERDQLVVLRERLLDGGLAAPAAAGPGPGPPALTPVKTATEDTIPSRRSS